MSRPVFRTLIPKVFYADLAVGRDLVRPTSAERDQALGDIPPL